METAIVVYSAKTLAWIHENHTDEESHWPCAAHRGILGAIIAKEVGYPIHYNWVKINVGNEAMSILVAMKSPAEKPNMTFVHAYEMTPSNYLLWEHIANWHRQYWKDRITVGLKQLMKELDIRITEESN